MKPFIAPLESYAPERRFKLAVVGDSHFDESSRFDDCIRIHDWIADDALAAGCHVLVHTGDIFERKSTSREREAVSMWLRRVSEDMPVVLVGGNHDDPLDIELLGQLEGAKHPIFSCSTTETFQLGNVTLCCLAWPRRAYIAEAAAGLVSDEINAHAATALRNLLRSFSVRNPLHEDSRVPVVVVAHAMIRGSRTSESQPPLVGQDFELGLDDLALADADAYALGHIHLGQEWPVELPGTSFGTGRGVYRPAFYPGSPRRCNFGELDEKAYVIATFEGRRCVSVERRRTPAAPMIHFEAEYLPATDESPPAFRFVGLADHRDPEHVAGAEVRLRYSVAAEHRAPARELAEIARTRFELDGAKIAKIEERVTVVNRARAPEVTAAVGTWDKLLAFWKSRPDGARCEDGRLDALAAKLEAIEGPL